MKTAPMMKCGHTAQGRVDDTFVCVICMPDPDAYIIADSPDLTNRQAKCGACGRLKSSSLDLPFFEYLGPESNRPQEFDKYYCGCIGWD